MLLRLLLPLLLRLLLAEAPVLEKVAEDGGVVLILGPVFETKSRFSAGGLGLWFRIWAYGDCFWLWVRVWLGLKSGWGFVFGA